MPDWQRLVGRLRRAGEPTKPSEDGVPAEIVRKGYEPSDVNLRVVGGVAVAIVILALIIHIGLLLLLRGIAAQEGERLPVPSMTPPPDRFPRPTLQIAPQADLERLRLQEEGRLMGYHWIDRASGVVQIPIDRAMDLLAERGLPRRAGHAP